MSPIGIHRSGQEVATGNLTKISVGDFTNDQTFESLSGFGHNYEFFDQALSGSMRDDKGVFTGEVSGELHFVNRIFPLVPLPFTTTAFYQIFTLTRNDKSQILFEGTGRVEIIAGNDLLWATGFYRIQGGSGSQTGISCGGVFSGHFNQTDLKHIDPEINFRFAFNYTSGLIGPGDVPPHI